MFPPLPATISSHSNIHSRVSSLPSVGSSKAKSVASNIHLGTERSSTPRVPPGFENVQTPHRENIEEGVAREEPNFDQEEVKPSPAPVIPAVPQVLHASNTALSKTSIQQQEKKEKEDTAGSAQSVTRLNENRVVNAAQVDAPEARHVASDKSAQQTTKPPRSSSPNQLREILPPPKLADFGRKPTSQNSSRAQIAKQNTVLSVETGPKDASNPPTPDAKRSVPVAVTPKPVTLEMSEVKRPVTLRLTTEMINKAQKAESAVPVSAATEKSNVFPSQLQHPRGSRQASVSTSRPSTPAASDHFGSHDVSRASSPPGNNAGLGTRGKTRSQLKKERRDKGKKDSEAGESTSSATPVVSSPPAIAPIVARQKKQKRQKPDVLHDPSHSPTVQQEGTLRVVEQTKTTTTDEPKEQVKKNTPSPVADKEPSTITAALEPVSGKEDGTEKAPQPPSKPYTLRDFYTEALKMQARTGASSVDIQQLLLERVSPMSTLLSEMIADGDLSKDHPWFNPQAFNSSTYKLPSDPRKGQDYLDGNGYSNNDAFGYVYLPQKEKRALFNGHAVSVADSGDRKKDLLRRCLITPNGWVMRHLTSEESEKVLDLEERRNLYIEEHGEVGMMAGLGVLEQDDFINLGGGFDELARFGDRHGICWVVGDREHEERETEATGLERDYGLDELIDDRDMLEDRLSDETDEDLGIDMMSAGTIPGSWDPAFPATGTDLSGDTLPPIHGQYGRNINLRAMDMDTLQKRLQEKQKEADSARKDAEKAEKALGKKSKDHTRWRESIYKAVDA